jgi:MYXO-CTERM domain-containing protein
MFVAPPRRTATGYTPLLLALTVAAALLAAAPGYGQVVVFDSQGFEPSAGYTANVPIGPYGTTAVAGSWASTDLNQLITLPPAGFVQTATANGGTQAFKISGPGMRDDPTFSDQTFWFRGYPTAGSAFTPGAATPIVRVTYDQRIKDSGPVNTADIPLVGFYMEGFTATGQQQQVGFMMLNLNNGATAITAGGTTLSTTNGIYTRDAWHNIEVDFNFATQTYSATLDGLLLNFGGVTNLPFRNTNGPTVSIAEYGFQASFNTFSGSNVNDAFFDNFLVTATAVPEPTSLALAGLAGLGVAWRWRRRRAAADTPAIARTSDK